MAAVQRSRVLLTLSDGFRSSCGIHAFASSYLTRQQLVRGHPFLLRPPFHLPSSGRSISSESLPYILQPSFWRSLVPKFMRSKRDAVPEEQKVKKKDWNPATFFIAIFMLIGSQAIQMIAMRRDFNKFSNQTEARLAKLREVVRRIMNGEDVDVEALLGTGDKQAEREWEDVIRELEEEDSSYRDRRRKSKKAAGGRPENGREGPSDATSQA